mmetsp:Transcript_13157/g.36064  ORF Transcript_13157/g.36064 Transcript_13157/m.36064 type:complete len:345 (+) Transcript_13157:103-1137(+)
MHTAAPRPDIRTAMLLTGRVGPSSRAESGRGASTSRPGRCATIPRRAWHESSGDIGDTSDPEDPEARSRRLGFTTTSQLFKNAKKLERKTDKADKAEADLAMLDNLVDGNVESFEWFGGGGRNFSELVSQQGDVCAASRYEPDSEEERLDEFWRSRGVREQAYRERLVRMGATLASEVAGRSLYRNPDILGHRLDRLQTVFPGMDVAQMMWKSPDVVKLPIKTVVSRFVSLRWTLTNVGDVSTIVEGQPGILLRHSGEIAGEMAALANEFPAVDVGAVVVREPCLLTAECELTRRLKRLAELRRRDRLSPSMRIFYDGSDGSGNAMLFAKVFMEETKPHDGNWW